jgi:3-oxoacyl-[acyl-carrier protein] reductase
MSGVAAVTGAARGIGLAIARNLIDDGWSVAGCDILEDPLRERAEELGESFRPFVLDVTDGDRVADVTREMEDSMGPVTGLVNNAGITRDTLMMRMGREDWDSVISVNLTGAFLMSKALSRGMMRARKGSIVNISSVVALLGGAGQVNYSASKAGLLGLTRSLCRELGARGIRVNAIAPGFIETEMTADLPEEVREGYSERIPLGRMGTPEDVAEAVRFLLSDDSQYISGVVLPVDGGLTT